MAISGTVLACLNSTELSFHEMHDDGFASIGSFETSSLTDFILHDRDVILIENDRLLIKTFQVCLCYYNLSIDSVLVSREP